jgi:hypothetical protein
VEFQGFAGRKISPRSRASKIMTGALGTTIYAVPMPSFSKEYEN